MYYFAYGNYVHAGGEVTVSVTKSPLRSEIGTYTGFTQQMTISGVLQANSADELTAALLLLELEGLAEALPGAVFVRSNRRGS